MPRVIISSGHTAASPGVTANGLQEYDIAHKIAKYALKYIRLNGIISLSVPPNLDLKQRLDWINKTGYMRETNDIAIEIHINDGDRSGLEGWFEGDGGNPSQGVAVQILDAVSRESGLPNLGAKSEFQHPMGSIAFVHEINPHSIILECGYLDNESDAAFLKIERNLEACGKGIAKGILNYYGLEYREVSPVSNPSGVISSPATMPIGSLPAQSDMMQQPNRLQQTAAMQAGTTQAVTAQPGALQQPVQQPMPQTPAQVVPVVTPAGTPVSTSVQPTAAVAAVATAPVVSTPVVPVVQPVPQSPVVNPNTYPAQKTQADDFDDEYTDYDDDFDDDLIKTTMQNNSTPATNASQNISQSTLQNLSATPTANPATPNYGGNYGAPAYPGNYGYPGQTTGAGAGIGAGAGVTATPGATSGFPSREERKQMITNNYIKILGREPNQNDLNYFLNVGIREDELLKKMVDSQEHADLVKARQEVITMKKQFNETQEELQLLRSFKEDQKRILDQMDQSISQKNVALTKLQYDINELQQKQHVNKIEAKKPTTGKKYKGTFVDKVFKAFSDILE